MTPEARAKALVETLNGSTFSDNDDYVRKATHLIAKAIRDAVEAEREECANLVQNYREDKPGTFAELGRRMRIALAIRSRSEKAPHRPAI